MTFLLTWLKLWRKRAAKMRVRRSQSSSPANWSWKQTAPTLERGWWNGAGFGGPQIDAIKAVEPLRNRWSTLLQTLYALREIRYTESANLVADLNKLWRSLPHMSGDQVAEACDDYLKTVNRDRGNIVPH